LDILFSKCYQDYYGKSHEIICLSVFGESLHNLTSPLFGNFNHICERNQINTLHWENLCTSTLSPGTQGDILAKMDEFFRFVSELA
jgi:hypothetical protein